MNEARLSEQQHGQQISDSAVVIEVRLPHFVCVLSRGPHQSFGLVWLLVEHGAFNVRVLGLIVMGD